MSQPEEDPDLLKMYCVVSKEALVKMNGVRGKLATQAGHAYLHCWWDADLRHPEMASAYRDSARAYKITLLAAGDVPLMHLEAAYRSLCGVALITDAGLTVFKEPTVTCLGIGPLPNRLKGQDLRDLRPLT